MANGKPTLHYLQHSGSLQSLWLLEELGIEYDLVVYTRGKNGISPSFKERQPLGKAPQLVTASGRVVAERSAITYYLIDTYDDEGRFKVPTPEQDPDWDSKKNDRLREEQIFSTVMTTMNLCTSMKVSLGVIANYMPFFVRPLLQGLVWGLGQIYLNADIDKCFNFLEGELEGRKYFNGTKNPTGLDFTVQWYVDFAFQGCRVDLSLYPRVKEWYERCISRDAWKRAIEKGNGYDLEFWKMRFE